MSAPTQPDPLLLRFLADREAACPVCAYALHGLTGDRCPECGVALRLSVDTPDSRLAAWCLAVVATSLPTGFCLLLGAWVLVMFAFQAGGPGLDEAWPLFAGAAAGGATIVGLLRGRRRYRRARGPVRWTLAALAPLVPIAFTITFFVVIS